MTSYEKCQVTLKDLDDMVFYTVRYALGRMTAVVENSQEYVEKYKEHISTRTLEQMRCEIANELEKRERKGETLGMAYDHESWHAFIKKISVILKERENES